MLRLSFIVLLLTILLPSSAAMAQDTNGYLYKEGKSLFRKGKYNKSYKIFQELLVADPESNYTPYCLFYKGLCNYYLGEKDEATIAFLSIAKNFPDWSQVDEVNYWLGLLYFECGDAALALSYLSRIQAKVAHKSIKQLKQHFLKELSLGQLQALHLKGVTAHEITQFITQKMEEEKENTTSSNEGTPTESDPISQPGPTYNVAVLMPFFIEDMASDDYPNEFILSIYEGIKIAAKSLSEEGIQLKVHAYDTKKDADVTKQLLSLTELKNMDLLIGPLYEGPIQKATSFAKKHGINMVNPLSYNSEIIHNKRNSFLMNPSLETQSRAAARFTLNDLPIPEESPEEEIPLGIQENNLPPELLGPEDPALEDSSPTLERPSTDEPILLDPPSIEKEDPHEHPQEEEQEEQEEEPKEPTLPVAIVYGDKREDKVRAESYKAYLEEATGKKVATMLFLPQEKAECFMLFIRNPERNEELYQQYSFEGISQIYIASDDELLINTILSTIDLLKKEVKVMGHGNCLSRENINLQQLQRLGVTLIAPHYIDYSNQAIRLFRATFRGEYAKFPDHFSYLGYETMYFFGGMLSTYGKDFHHYWADKVHPGRLFTGFKYGIHHDNQLVPIVKLQRNGTLLICNDLPHSDQNNQEAYQDHP